MHRTHQDKTNLPTTSTSQPANQRTQNQADMHLLTLKLRDAKSVQLSVTTIATTQ